VEGGHRGVEGKRTEAIGVRGVEERAQQLIGIERKLAARPADRSSDLHAEREIERLVRELTGSSPQKVRLLSTDVGRILFLTLNAGGDRGLSDAHRLAGDLEEELRLRVGDLADVVVHTEP